MCFVQQFVRFGKSRAASALQQKFGAKLFGHNIQTVVDIFILQIVQSFADFYGVAGCETQNLVHIGQNRAGFGAGGVRHADNRLRQSFGVIKTPHKRTVAAF